MTQPRKLRVPAVVYGPDKVSYTFDGSFTYDPVKGWVETKQVPSFFAVLKAIDILYYEGKITEAEVNERRAKVLSPPTQTKETSP